MRFNIEFTYIVDKVDIKICLHDHREILTVKYPQAAILDLLLKSYSSDEIILMMQKIAHVSQHHAKSLYQDFLSELVELGILLH